MWIRARAIATEPTDRLTATLRHERSKPDGDAGLMLALESVLAGRESDSAYVVSVPDPLDTITPF